MDIRSGLEGLKTILGVTPGANAGAQRSRAAAPPEPQTLSGDRATLSTAGSQVAQSEAEGGVRASKVAAIQAALQAGTYNVPASAVAAKMVDSMLDSGK